MLRTTLILKIQKPTQLELAFANFQFILTLVTLLEQIQKLVH